MGVKRMQTWVGVLFTVMLTAFLLVANDEGAEDWTEESEIDFKKRKGDTYYISGSDTVLLFEQPIKVAALHRKGKAKIIDGVDNLVYSRVWKRKYIDIVIYEYYETDKAVRKAQMDKYHLFPCYYDKSKFELVPAESITVLLKKEEDRCIVPEIARQFGCEILDLGTDLFCELFLDPELHLNPVEVANSICETGLFVCAEPQFAFRAIDFSYDPYIAKQWALYNSYNYTGVDMSVSKAWNFATGRGVKVAVVDGGIMLDHSDLKDNVYVKSYDAESGKLGSKIRDSGHGTYCAGIIAAVRNNNKCVVGIAPDAKLMSVPGKL